MGGIEGLVKKANGASPAVGMGQRWGGERGGGVEGGVGPGAGSGRCGRSFVGHA